MSENEHIHICHWNRRTLLESGNAFVLLSCQPLSPFKMGSVDWKHKHKTRKNGIFQVRASLWSNNAKMSFSSVVEKNNTFLSWFLGPPGAFCLRKPAVVDHLVGFFREGSSETKLFSLTDVERPTNAGSLLRRTCRGISEEIKRKIN